MGRTVRVGTRRSELALVQTRLVIRLLQEAIARDGGEAIEFVEVAMATTGDRILHQPLSQIGQKSLFTKELEAALDAQQVDLVVHSLKDVPTQLPAGLVLGAILPRACPDDVLLVNPRHKGVRSLDKLPHQSVIGTSSLRRGAQLLSTFGSDRFVVRDVRGNLQTRLSKLDNTSMEYDALLLAAAGVERLGWSDRIEQRFEGDLYAVGQGALGVECREGDAEARSLLARIHCAATFAATEAERAFLRGLGGGCSTPVGVRTSFDTAANTLTARGAVYLQDGSRKVEHTVSAPLDGDAQTAAEVTGGRLARELMAMGGKEILDAFHDKQAK